MKEYRDKTAQITEQVCEQMETGGGYLRNAILKITNDLENHQKVSAKQLSDADTLSKQMSDEITQWSKLAEHTRKSLVEATEQLVNVIKKS